MSDLLDLPDDLRRATLGVLMPGFSGTTIPAWLEPHLRDGVGGVCLFAMNTPDVERTRALCEALAAANPDLLIALDEEGGDVSRLQAATGSALPGNAALGAVDDEDVTRQAGAAIGALVRAAGAHLTIAPVLDVASNPHNPVIGVRAFGADPQAVRRHGVAFIEGLHEAGAGGCAKHFPGHGDTATDSHMGLPVINIDPELLRQRDLTPFEAVAGATDAVMTAHIVVPQLGPYPATLSPWAYQWLRETGFEGPVITDALGMAAVAAGDDDHPAGVGVACVRALQAGADLLCLDSPQNRDEVALFTESYNAVGQALLQGQLTAESLRASAERTRRCVQTITARAGWGQDAPLDEAAIEAFGDRVATESLRTTGNVAATETVWLADLRRSANWAAGDLGSIVLDTLNESRERAGLLPIEPVTTDQIASLDPADTVVLVTKQPLVDPAEAGALDEGLAARPDAIVLHTGMMSAAPAGERMICCHGLARPNLRAAAAALSGLI